LSPLRDDDLLRQGEDGARRDSIRRADLELRPVMVRDGEGVACRRRGPPGVFEGPVAVPVIVPEVGAGRMVVEGDYVGRAEAAEPSETEGLEVGDEVDELV